MEIKYNITLENAVVCSNLRRIINQIYKLLPVREEGSDWQKPLKTVIYELAGMNNLLNEQQDNFFKLLCKLESLFLLDKEEDFLEFRRTIFESLSLVEEMIKRWQQV
jgi:hypothetical protein